MSTDLAIAAIKAQALWDAGEQLRKQAAGLHPEFARMIGEPERAKEALQVWARNSEAVLQAARRVLPLEADAVASPLRIGEVVEQLVDEVGRLRDADA